MPENEGSKPPKAQKPRFCAREGWQEGLGAAAGQRKEHREEERVLRATKMKNREEERELRATKKKHREEERELRTTKKKHREEQMRTKLFIFEVGQVKAVLGCNVKMFLL